MPSCVQSEHSEQMQGFGVPWFDRENLPADRLGVLRASWESSFERTKLNCGRWHRWHQWKKTSMNTGGAAAKQKRFAALHDLRKAAREPRTTNVPHRLAALPRARLQTSPAFGAVPWEKLEAEVGVEPTRRGFADLGLPTWLLRRI